MGKDKKLHAEANKRYRLRQKGIDAPRRDKPWTKKEIAMLRKVYTKNLGMKTPWLKEFAQKIGRDKANVCRKAKALGLTTDRSRTVPIELRSEAFRRISKWRAMTEEEQWEVRSQRIKACHKKYGHPRGMLGKTHTAAIRKIISEATSRGIWLPKTQAQRDRQSQLMVKRMKERPELLHTSPRGKVGKREDLGGQYFRSRWEANYARFLNFTKQKWEYEKKTFWFTKIKRGSRSYTPDFFLPAINEYHEVKGWMDQKSKTKLKRMAKYYPEVCIVIIDQKWFAAASRQRLHKIIPHWEQPGVRVEIRS